MTSNHIRQTALLVLGFGMIAAGEVMTQSVDSTRVRLQPLVAGLRDGALVRFADEGRRWSGKLAARSPDTLTIVGDGGTRAVPLRAIDTLWVRGPSHRGLLAGAGFGALMFGLLQLGEGSGEDPGLNNSFGWAILLGATAAGLAGDAVSDPWVQRYPGKPRRWNGGLTASPR